MRRRLLPLPAAFILLLAPVGAADDVDGTVAERLRHGDAVGARQILEEAPAEQAATHLARARLLIATGASLKEVERELRAAQRLDPSTPAALIRLGTALRDAGALDEAEAVLYEGLERFRDDPELLRLLATVRLARDETGPAVRLLEKAVHLSPEDARIRRDLGLALASAGLPGQALLHLQEARKAAPDDLAVRAALVEVYTALQDARHAGLERQAVLRIRELSGHARTRQEAQWSISARISEMEAAAASAAPPAGTFRELASLYLRRDDLGWSLPRLQKLAARHDGAEARAAVALARAGGGDAGAGAALREALAGEPANLLALEGLLLLPAAEIPAGDLVAAARVAAEAMPEDPDAASYLGTALARAGDAEAAAEAFRRALALDPAHGRSAVALADLLRSRGDAAEADRVLQEVGALRDDDPDIVLALGLTALARGDDAAASEQLLRAYDLGVEHPELLESLAELAARRGDPIAAAAYRRGAPDDEPHL
jgi:Flp pilus assembly protein TadD